MQEHALRTSDVPAPGACRMGATRLRESLGYVYFPAGAAYSWMWTNARRARARRSSSSFLPSFPPSCNVCSSSCAIHHAPPLHSAMYSVVCTASSCDVDDNDDDAATSFCFLPAILSLSLSLSLARDPTIRKSTMGAAEIAISTACMRAALPALSPPSHS